jgi:hypothetical protein
MFVRDLQIQEHTVGIPRALVYAYVRRCSCRLKHAQKPKAPLRPIVVNSLWERIQVTSRSASVNLFSFL